MKGRCFILITLSIAANGLLPGQQCLGTINLDTRAVCMKHILSVNNVLPLEVAKGSMPERGDIELLHRYYHTSSYDEYRKIYLPSDWYGLTEKDYGVWMEYMSTKQIQIEGAVIFIESNITYSCIQFFIIDNGVYDRLSFLSKKINNFWYPSSQEEEERFAFEKGFFRCVRPQFLEYLLLGKASDQIRSHQRIPAIREKVMKGSELNGRALMVDRRAITTFRSEDYNTLYFNLDERVDPESWYQADRVHDGTFGSYLDSLQIPADQKEAVMIAIRDFRYIEAAVLIARAQGSQVYTPVHTEAIRRIYGNDRLIVIESKDDNE
jgi:hypothetical protein